MGFRFRKSIKIAPGLKLNFNKKSTGLTFGGKGLHYTINSKGKKNASVGLPGTGLSYSITNKSKKNSKEDYSEKNYFNEKEDGVIMKEKKSKKGCLPAIIGICVVFGIIGSCGSTDSSEDVTNAIITEITTTVESTTLYGIAEFSTAKGTTTKHTVTTTEESTTTTGTASTTEQKTTTTTRATTTEKETTTTTKKATTTKKDITTKKPTTKNATTTKKAVVDNGSPQQGEMVWIPQSGKKYHSDSSCSNMKNPSKVTVSKAKSLGLTACSKCY